MKAAERKDVVKRKPSQDFARHYFLVPRGVSSTCTERDRPGRVGSPRMNVLSGKVVGVSETNFQVRIPGIENKVLATPAAYVSVSVR